MLAYLKLMIWKGRLKKLENFSQRHVIMFSFAITLIAVLIWTIQWDVDPFMGFDMILSHAITFILAIWLIKKILLFQTVGFKENGLFKGLLLGTPLLILGVISSVFSNMDTDYSQIRLPDARRTLIFTVSMFMVGAAEEIVFRGILLNNMIKKWGKNQKGIIKAIIFSAFIFGLVHLINIFHVPLITLVVQTLNAACAGILFSVIYIICRNIWAIIFVHMLTDWAALFLQHCFYGTNSIVINEMSISQGLIVVAVGSFVPLFFSVIYARGNFQVE